MGCGDDDGDVVAARGSDESTEAEPETAEHADCDTGDHRPGNFPCAQAVLCEEADRDDEIVGMSEFLCAARDATGEPTVAMADVLAALPMRLRKNFTLKHGTRERGLRGHPQEVMADVVGEELAKNSQSADLDFPRAIFWDEVMGFTISYNGGLSHDRGNAREQTGADRLDLFGYDAETDEFELWALDQGRCSQVHNRRLFRSGLVDLMTCEHRPLGSVPLSARVLSGGA